MTIKCAGEPEEDPSEDEPSNVYTIGNRVYFWAEVSSTNVALLIQKLHDATDVALSSAYWWSDARVYLYVHSNGGCVFSGLAAMDHIRNNRVPVVTVADGFVASAATLLLLGSDERKAHKNSRFLMHQLRTGFEGKYAELLDEMENSREVMSSLSTVYTERTSMNKRQVENILRKEIHMTAEEAMENGIVDEVW